MIKLQVSFNNVDEDHPNWDAMGIDPPSEEGNIWRKLYFNPDNIICTGIDNNGTTNLLTVDSEVWVVKETPLEIVQKIKELE